MACTSITLSFGSSAQQACLNSYLNYQTLTQYVDNTTLGDSTKIYADDSCTIYSNPGFYSDGVTTVQWGINPSTEQFEILSSASCSYSNNLKNCCDINSTLTTPVFDWTNISSYDISGLLPVGLVLNITGQEEGTSNIINQCYIVVSDASTTTFTSTTVSNVEFETCSECNSYYSTVCYLAPGKYYFSSCDSSSETIVFTIQNSRTFSYESYVIYNGKCYSPILIAPEDSTSLMSFSTPDGNSCGSALECFPTPTPTPTNVSIYVKDCCYNNIYKTSSETLRAVGLFILDNQDLNCYTVIQTPVPLPPYIPTIDDTNFSLGTYNYDCLNPNPECIDCQQVPQPTPTPTSSPIPQLSPNQCDVTTLLPLSVICETTDQYSENQFNGTLNLIITGGTKPYNVFLNGVDMGSQTFFQNLAGGIYNVIVTDSYKDFTATTTCNVTAPSPSPTPTITPTPSSTPPPVYDDICIQFTIDGQYYSLLFDYTTNLVWTSGTYVLSAKTNNAGYKIYNWDGSGSIETTSTNLPPINGWQILGVTNPPNITVTYGSCPPAPPLLQTVSKTDNSCQGSLPCTGNITISAQGGVPPYSYSINNGLTYQGSPLFNGVCPNTYTVITKDNNDTQTTPQTIVVTSLQNPVSYTLSLTSNVTNVTIPIQFVPSGPTFNFQGKKTEFQVVCTPPLPIGTTITLSLGISSNRSYSPLGATGTYTTSRYSKNFVYSGTTLLTPLVTKTDTNLGGSSGSRIGCAGMTIVSDFSGVTYNNLILRTNEVISGYTLSTPIVSTGVGYSQPCPPYVQVTDQITIQSGAKVNGTCVVSFAGLTPGISTMQEATGNNFPT